MVIDISSEKYILEIGPGVARQSVTSIAIDKFPEADCEIVRDVAHRGIPFSDNTFDAVLSMDVIEHIERYEDLVFLINEIWRVLKPEGTWFFTTPEGNSGLQFFTHHRTFYANSFDYFKYDHVVDATWDGMRKADGIVALFDTILEPHATAEVIQGKFIKKTERSANNG